MKNTENSSKPAPKYEIRVAGSGGQGIILAGIILAEAALLDGKYVTQSQNYGPESRGGNSTSEVILSDAEIDYPKASKLDILTTLTQEACNRNLPYMKAGGVVIADSDLVPRIMWRKVVSIPFQRIAQEAGEPRAINIAALGAMLPFCPSITRDSLVSAISKRLPSTKLEANLKAFDKALKLAHDMSNIKEGLRVEETDKFSI